MNKYTLELFKWKSLISVLFMILVGTEDIGIGNIIGRERRY